MPADDFKEHLATNIYYDRQFDCDAAKVLPGEYFYTEKNMVIVTVLGSCVAACIRDRLTGIGGMNHFMLPETGKDAGGIVSPSMRYGTYAMEVLINSLLKAGARRENLEAKVFGGGKVLPSHVAMNVGERNATFVLEYLSAENIPVLAEDLNDIHPRKVYFFPRTGKVLVKKLREMHNNTLTNREQDYVSRLQSGRMVGDIELFN
jgi:chemotaxis protein CheD